MAGSGNRFAEAVRIAHKGKAAAKTTDPPSKCACQVEEVVMLPPIPQPTEEELTLSQPRSFSMGAFTSTPIPADPAPANMGIESLWPPRIQHLAVVLNQAPSLLDNLTLDVLLIKSTLRPANCCRLNGVETYELFDNVLHSTLESALCTYVAKQNQKP